MAERRSDGNGRSGFAAGRGDDYWTLSSRPLYALCLTFPLVLLYELGSLIYLTDLKSGQQQVIRAEKLLGTFFQTFGVVGLVVPGLAMLLVLLIWHVLSRDRWKVKPVVLLGMTMESALWSLPLLVFGALLQRAALGQIGTNSAMVAGSGADAFNTLSWQALLTISLGAGLYEELLFRLVAIAGLHFFVKDLLKLDEVTARVAAIMGSALAFAVYHDVTLSGGGINWHALGFYTAAGIYFACIYLFRGFGIVVAAHAIYDVIVLVVLPSAGN